MPICGRLISKPGYSTFSEALCFDLPIISLTRQGFAEAPILLEAIQNYSDHQIIDSHEFFTGDWNFLHQTMSKPLKSERLAKDGATQIAQEILDYFASI